MMKIEDYKLGDVVEVELNGNNSYWVAGRVIEICGVVGSGRRITVEYKSPATKQWPYDAFGYYREPGEYVGYVGSLPTKLTQSYSSETANRVRAKAPNPFERYKTGDTVEFRGDDGYWYKTKVVEWHWSGSVGIMSLMIGDTRHTLQSYNPDHVARVRKPGEFAIGELVQTDQGQQGDIIQHAPNAQVNTWLVWWRGTGEKSWVNGYLLHSVQPVRSADELKKQLVEVTVKCEGLTRELAEARKERDQLKAIREGLLKDIREREDRLNRAALALRKQ